MANIIRSELVMDDGTAISFVPTEGRRKYVHYADRFSVWGQTISFNQNYDSHAIFKEVLEERAAVVNDPALKLISWRAHVAASIATQVKELGTVFVECGVNAGILSACICKTLARTGRGKLKKFYLFDTYEGIPADQFDPAKEPLAVHHNTHNYNKDIYPFVKQAFQPYEYVQPVKGRVPEVLDKYKDIRDVAYLSIDMNIVAPERAAMEFFWDRMVTGGIVLLDDYGFAGHEPQQTYFDAFCRERKMMPIHLPTGQALIIKS